MNEVYDEWIDYVYDISSPLINATQSVYDTKGMTPEMLAEIPVSLVFPCSVLR